MYYEIPGFDPKTFTDDELLKKQTELMAKINWAWRFSNDSGINMMQMMLGMIENERRERNFLEIWKKYKNNDTIESEPDLQAEVTEKKEKNLPPVTVRPTLKPVINKDLEK